MSHKQYTTTSAPAPPNTPVAAPAEDVPTMTGSRYASMSTHKFLVHIKDAAAGYNHVLNSLAITYCGNSYGDPDDYIKWMDFQMEWAIDNVAILAEEKYNAASTDGPDPREAYKNEFQEFLLYALDMLKGIIFPNGGAEEAPVFGLLEERFKEM